MLFRNYCLLALSSLAMAAGQFDDMSFAVALSDDIFFGPPPGKNEENQGGHHLRRRLANVCTTTAPATVYKDCSGTYSCSCGTCNFCPGVSTSRGLLCQMSQSSTTYFDRDCHCTKTCTCTIYDDGTVAHECHNQDPPAIEDPIPPPTPPEDNNPPQDDGDREDGDGTDGDVINPFPPIEGLGCYALLPYNPRICLGSPEYCNPVWINCDLLEDYACSCVNAPSQRQCSYCMVQTPSGTICQVSGSSSTAVGLDGNLMTYHCEDAGNGNVIQTSTPTGIAPSGAGGGAQPMMMGATEFP